MSITRFPHGILATPNLGGVGRLADMWGTDNIFFVDGTYGSASNDGLSPDGAVTLISTAVGLASKGASIYVRPIPPDVTTLVWYQDSIDIPINKSNISIYGAGGHKDGMGGVCVKPTTAGVGDHLIDVKGAGLYLENLKLTLNGGTANAGKSIVHAQSVYSSSWTSYPIGLTINDCMFQYDASHPSVGAEDGCSSVDLATCSNSVITNCTFHNCLGGIIIQTSFASYSNIHVLNNFFQGGPDMRDCDLIISMNSAACTGVVIHGNVFADGLPAHTGAGTARFVYFPYVTAGTGILSDNYFACADSEGQFGETGSQAVIADNFYNPGNWCEGSSNTAPYGIITT